MWFHDVNLTDRGLNMREVIIQLIAALAGSWGFAILFGVRIKLSIPAAIGGFLGWGVYLFGIHLGKGIFLSCLAAAAFAAFYAEVMARVFKAPATLFLVPGFIPLIPGSTLYYTMSNAVANDWEMMKFYANQTWQYALAIAGGISLVWAFSYMFTQIKKQIKNNG